MGWACNTIRINQCFSTGGRKFFKKICVYSEANWGSCDTGVGILTSNFEMSNSLASLPRCSSIKAILCATKLTICVETWQNKQNECAPSEDSDQPGHLPSLIRVFAVRMKKAWVLSYPLSAQRRLWSDWVDAEADLSLHWAHIHFVGFDMSWLICVGASPQ